MNWNRAQQIAATGLAAYGRITRRVVSSGKVLAGEPVFRGTRISVQHVATLLGKGIAEREIEEDFPALTNGHLAYAKLVARFTTKPEHSQGRLRLQRNT